jgi:hypothetical protein
VFRLTTMLVTCLIVSSAAASPTLYALADSSGGRALATLETDGSGQLDLIGETDAPTLFLTYLPASDDFVAIAGLADGGRAYQISRSTGVATAFPAAGGFGWNGPAFVPALDATLVAIGTPSGPPHNRIGRLESDGTASLLFNLSGQVLDIDSMAWDPTRALLYGWNLDSATLYVIDPIAGSLVDTRVGSISFRFPTVHPTTGMIYAEDPSNQTLGVYDPETLSLVSNLGTIQGTSRLYGLAFIPEPASLSMLLGLALLRGRNRS